VRKNEVDVNFEPKRNFQYFLHCITVSEDWYSFFSWLNHFTRFRFTTGYGQYV